MSLPAQNLGAIHAIHSADPRFREAQLVDEALGAERILRVLDSFPERIRDQQLEVSRAQQAANEANEQLKQRQAELLAEIIADYNPATGKPTFSNEQARQAELVRRQAEDLMYRQAQKRAAEAAEALDVARFNLDKLVNEFTSARLAAEIVANRLRLFAR